MEEIFKTLVRIREEKPLVHHITNWVTIYDCAAATRAFGALPVMAHAKEEAADMARLASALVLNIGTLTPEIIDAMLLAGNAANRKGIPIILDAVGAGATHFRTNEALRLLFELRISVLKGNAGELAALSGIKSVVKGVESLSAAAGALEIAQAASGAHKCVAAITGKEDFVVSSNASYIIANGAPIMGKVVGTGCMSASAIGAFCAVEKDFARASAAALCCFGIAGEMAAEKATGAGTWKPLFFDEIAALDESKIKGMAKVVQK